MSSLATLFLDERCRIKFAVAVVWGELLPDWTELDFDENSQ